MTRPRNPTGPRAPRLPGLKILLVVLAVPLAIVVYQAHRSGMSIGQMFKRVRQSEANTKTAGAMRGKEIEFLQPVPIGFASRFYEASAHFRKAIQFTPMNTAAPLNLAIELMQQSKYEQGFRQLDELLRINPRDCRGALLHGLRVSVDEARG